MTSESHQHPVRYHSLDALRAVAMLLGILLHVEMAYMTEVWSVWPVDDTASTGAADFIFWLIHLFRMEVFFLMAGFFACMLYARYGVKRFALHRLKRIALPLVIGMVTIIPLWRLVYVHGIFMRFPPEEPIPLWMGVIGSFIYDPETNPAPFHPAHLWFLQHLIVMYALAIAWLWISGKITPIARINAALTHASGWLLRHRLMTLALIALPFPLHFLQEGVVVDTQPGMFPPWNVVSYYTVFFTVGWLIFRNREQLDRLADFWIFKLALGVGLIFLLRPWSASGLNDGGWGAYPPATYLLSSAITALLVVGSTGMFLRVFHRQSVVMRYISDSAYWLYIAHLPVVVMVNILILDWQAPAIAKLLVSLAGSTIFLLATYQLCVRHTPIGLLLNGRMGGTRPPTAPVPAPATNGASVSNNTD